MTRQTWRKIFGIVITADAVVLIDSLVSGNADQQIASGAAMIILIAADRVLDIPKGKKKK